MKLLKSISALTAAFVMSVSALSAPIEAFAEIELPVSVEENTDIVTASGTCGNNTYWELSGDTLTVSGNGEVGPFRDSSEIPWYDYGDSIKKIIVKEGVTSLGTSAFLGCNSVTDFSIADSVVSIARYALPYCPWLESKKETEILVTAGRVLIDASNAVGDVVIPDGIKGIGCYAFSNADSVTSVLVPRSVENIDQYGLQGTGSIKKVTILNPECRITPSPSGSTLPSDSVVCSCCGSTAEEFVKTDVYCSSIRFFPIETDVFLSSSEFTIGNDSFEAYMTDSLDIYNSRGLALSFSFMYDTGIHSEYVSLSALGNTLTVKGYDYSERLVGIAKFEYDSATGKFGKADLSDCERYYFSVNGDSFYAEITKEYEKRDVYGNTESDQYNYLNVFFADGTSTNIQNKLVWIEYDRTGGFAGYFPYSFIDVTGSVLKIRRIEDSQTDIYDVITSYRYDKSGRNFIEYDPAGDIDSNAEVNTSDASAILEMYAGLAAGLDMSRFTYEQFNAADINIDGEITLEDSTYVLTYYAQNAAGINPTWETLCPARQDIPYDCPGTAINENNNNWTSLESVYTFDTDGDGIKETVAKYIRPQMDGSYDYDGFFRIYDKEGNHADVLLNGMGASASSHSAIIRDDDTGELMLVDFIYSGSNSSCGLSMYRMTLNCSVAGNNSPDAEYMIFRQSSS
ncbi:MAG: leucine-rich repeat protein, partial [Ruminococcus sp.]